MEKQLQNEVFQAEMERKLAQLLSEVSSRRRVWRRATITAGNSVVQVLQGLWEAQAAPTLSPAGLLYRGEMPRERWNFQ